MEWRVVDYNLWYGPFVNEVDRFKAPKKKLWMVLQHPERFKYSILQ